MDKLFGYLLLLFSFLASGCVNYMGGDNSSEKQKELPRELTVSEEELIQAEQSFSYEVFNRISEEDDNENILIAPMSLSLALGMTLNGAFGETREEVQQVLFFDRINLQELNDSYQSLTELLFSLDSRINMKTANAIWYREDISVKEEFTEVAEDYFSAEVLALNTDDREDAADTVNDWVENRTDGHIDRVISSVSRFMVMYLISAAYFRGDWLYGFDPDLTRREDFNLENGSIVRADMMEQEAELDAYVSEEVRMLDLPYGEDLFRMTLLMPGNPQEPVDEFIEETLTAGNMSFWTSELTTAGTLVKIPRFDLEYEQDLDNVLESMGMDEAFERSADFYNISDTDRLYLNEVRHKSRIVVDEEGVEVAPTSVESERRIDFNRSFVFVIREKNSGVVLFMGKVKDPTR